tara:strand:+ start:398 stop:622 length:225 start_codon:yes stop_codon:yes gene_type:complete
MFRRINYLIHLLYVAPLLIYSGFIGRKIEKSQVPEGDATLSEEAKASRPYKHVFNLLIVTGVVFFVYYVYMLIM